MIPREELVEQSVTDYLRNQLFNVRDYTADKVEILQAFERGRFDKMTALDKNYIAIGFSFDDGGRQAELGSDLRRRTYTIEFTTFGMSALWGRNLGNIIASALEFDGTIPLKDVGGTGEVIDVLLVDNVRAQRVPVGNPRPWNEHLWATRLVVVDEYFASQV